MTAGFTTNGNANVHKTSQCWGCGAVIFFDGKTVNPTTGKLQRFDAETKQVHHCDPAMRAEYQSKKDIEEAQQALAAPPPPRPPLSSSVTQQQQNTEHLLAVARHSQARLKIFRGTDPVVIEGLYNKFANEIRAQGGREKGTPSIALLNMQGLIEHVLYYYYDIPNENAGTLEKS